MPKRLSQHPIEYSGDQRSILQVGIDPVAQVGGIPVVPDVVDHPESAGDMQADRIRLRSLRKVLQVLITASAFIVVPSFVTVSLDAALSRLKTASGKPTSFHRAESQATGVDVLLGIDVAGQEFVHVGRTELCGQSCTNGLHERGGHQLPAFAFFFRVRRARTG